MIDMESSEVLVRPADLKELDTLKQFEQGIVKAERPFDSTLKKGTISYYDLEALIKSPDAEVLVAVLDGEIIGSGYAQIKTALPYLDHSLYAHLGFMYVKPEYRRRGVNEKILEALKQWSIAKKLTEIRLDVYVENKLAQKAYEKVGFTPHMLLMRLGI
jgi:ribosomal protein S18 acetylase RimI-like enzyme